MENNVVEAIQNNSSALVQGLEGRKSLELISAIYESVETGKEVKGRFTPEKCPRNLDCDHHCRSWDDRYWFTWFG